MLNKLYEQYRDRAAFYVVYIMEAHPIDLWQISDNVRDDINITAPKSFPERADLADLCVRKLSIKIPELIDDMSNTTQEGYAAHPDRLYVIDRDGRVAYKSKPGPFGFKPSEMAQTLRRLMGESEAAGAPAR